MSKYLDELANLATASSSASPTLDNNTVQSLLQSKIKEQSDIDNIAAQLNPLRETDSGQKALTSLLSNQQADSVERAAAAQALNPGLKASIGLNGELSFTAAPGADLGFNYPSATKPKNDQQAKAPALTSFSDTFKQLQGMTDPNEIANTFAAANASATQWAASRRDEIYKQTANAMGLTSMKSQLEQDKVADQEFYNTYYGGQNLGPTDESLVNIRLYSQTQNEVEQEVARKLQSDPEAAAIKTQLSIMSSYVDTKLGAAFSTKATNDATEAALIPNDNVNAALLALGKDPMTASPQERQQVALGITSGNKVYTEAQEVGMASPASLAVMAFSSTGSLAASAERVLKSKFSEGSTAPSLIKASYKAFDTEILPTLSKEQQEALKMPATATASEKPKLQKEIETKKMSMVLERLATKRTLAFENSVSQWDAPQDPIIADEIQSIRANNKDLRIDQLASLMNFSGPNGQAKINALTAYIQSQSKNLADNDFFGAPMQYANELNAKALVQTLAVKSMVQAAAPGIYSYPMDNFGGADQ